MSRRRTVAKVAGVLAVGGCSGGDVRLSVFIVVAAAGAVLPEPLLYPLQRLRAEGVESARDAATTTGTDGASRGAALAIAN